MNNNQTKSPMDNLNLLYNATRQLAVICEIHDNLRIAAEALAKYITDNENAAKTVEKVRSDPV